MDEIRPKIDFFGRKSKQCAGGAQVMCALLEWHDGPAAESSASPPSTRRASFEPSTLHSASVITNSVWSTMTGRNLLQHFGRPIIVERFGGAKIHYRRQDPGHLRLAGRWPRAV